MKDEIKEILDRLKDSATNPIVDVPVMGGVSEPIDNSQCLEPNECKILLDYITNLQEENEKLKDYYNDNVNNYEDLLIKYCNLREENEKLKKINDLRIEEHNTIYQYMKTYKSRNEKAIEYIKEHIRIDDEYPAYMEMLVEEKNELLNILQGGDE